MSSLGDLARTQGTSQESLLAEIMSAQAVDGLMMPEDMAETYMFLASEGGRNITGQAINVDRGEVMS